MPAFSIIVPIYNAQRTLRRCLDSLRGQTFEDFEVLMIENGSADGSNAICREFAADSRFRLHACGENCGPSGARNIGLEAARGQWVAFVDSDDYVTPDYLERLRRAFLEDDVGAVFFGFRQVDMDGREIAVRVPQVPAGASNEAVLLELSRQDLFGYTWIKAFRADAIGEHRFSTALDLMEDEVFACEVLSGGCRAAVLAEPIYYYVTGNAASLMGRTHPDYPRKLNAAYGGWKKLLAGSPRREELLGQKARTFVERCMYYGFERKLDADAFFRQLRRCGFFRDAAPDTAFGQAVRDGDFHKLRQMRRRYRLKVALSKLLRR